jgi:3-oxoacyl-[acyl-carrier protein] reductase
MEQTGFGNLNKRTAIITGASGRAGQAVTKVFAAAGARLLLVGSNAEKLANLEREAGLSAEQVCTLAVDLRQPQAAQQVLQAALAAFGRADILVHLVGGWVGGQTVPETPQEALQTMLEQHLWTTFYLAQAFIPHFRANGWGRLIVVSSPNAALTPGKMGAYNVGKAAQEALIGTLAEELKGSPVTANVLRVRTIDVEASPEAAPGGRGTTPEEIAAAVLYLCSQQASMINGARIPLYGSA